MLDLSVHPMQHLKKNKTFAWDVAINQAIQWLKVFIVTVLTATTALLQLL